MENIDEGTVERLLREALIESGGGQKLTERARLTQRTVDDYLKAGVRPRWMERQSEIERATRRHRAAIERAHRELGGDAEAWRTYAERHDFSDVNTLIRQHNEWYPIERDLPMDPRTGEYRKILGRTHHRRELDAGWILEQYPAR